MEGTTFALFVKTTFLDFMMFHQMAKGTISDGCGNRATVTMDKHGFYKITTSLEETKRVSETEECTDECE